MIAGISATTHDRRGANSSSAFSAFKTRLGFDSRYVFHNGFRGMVQAELRNAGVQEHVIDQIVGHEETGLRARYINKEVPLAVKYAAIKKLKY